MKCEHEEPAGCLEALAFIALVMIVGTVVAMALGVQP